VAVANPATLSITFYLASLASPAAIPLTPIILWAYKYDQGLASVKADPYSAKAA
jgi:hypothetical protein